jgi:hypothetical protein
LIATKLRDRLQLNHARALCRLPIVRLLLPDALDGTRQAVRRIGVEADETTAIPDASRYTVSAAVIRPSCCRSIVRTNAAAAVVHP